MTDGAFMKYKISKADGSPVDPDACYFVLRLDTDDAARYAMRAYAEEIDNDDLANDILLCVDELERQPCGCREAMCPHEPMYGSKVWRHGGSETVPDTDT